MFDRSYENTTKKYRKTYTGQKSHRKSEWKTKAGMIFYDFDKEYEYFYNLDKCELCNCEFTDKIKNVKTTIIYQDIVDLLVVINVIIVSVW